METMFRIGENNYKGTVKYKMIILSCIKVKNKPMYQASL